MGGAGVLILTDGGGFGVLNISGCGFWGGDAVGGGEGLNISGCGFWGGDAVGGGGGSKGNAGEGGSDSYGVQTWNEHIIHGMKVSHSFLQLLVIFVSSQ